RFAALARELVYAAVGATLGLLPRRAHEPVVLEPAQRAVEPAGVVARESERPQLLEQVVAMRGPFAQQQKQAGPDEVLRERGGRLSGHASPRSAPPGSEQLPRATRDTSSPRRTRRDLASSCPRTRPRTCACRCPHRAWSARSPRPHAGGSR